MFIVNVIEPISEGGEELNTEPARMSFLVLAISPAICQINAVFVRKAMGYQVLDHVGFPRSFEALPRTADAW